MTWVRLRERVLIAVLFGMGAGVGVETTQAGLGEEEGSAQKDGSVLYTQSRSFSRRSFQFGSGVSEGLGSEPIKVIHLEVQGVQVREYSSLGVIFAVAWSGSAQPDLQLLLGKFNEDLRRALVGTPRVAHHRQAHALLKGDRVLVEKWGHLGAMQGRAYVPDLMPEGFRPEDLE
jgi:hypothetical protein